MDINKPLAKIKIEINDIRKYAEVALFVDREDFLSDLLNARKKLGLSHLLSRSNLKKWEYTELEKTISNTQNKLPVLKKDKYSVVSMPLTESDEIIHSIISKYHKPKGFWLVIERALFCGIVTDDDYATAYCDILDPDFITLAEPELAIILSPFTSEDELLKIYKDYLPLKIKEYQEKYQRILKIALDTLSNIKRDRDWYWLKKEMSYSELHKNIPDGRSISIDGVKRAVQRYKRYLNSPI